MMSGMSRSDGKNVFEASRLGRGPVQPLSWRHLQRFECVAAVKDTSDHLWRLSEGGASSSPLLSGRVTQKIRDLILSGELQPGARIGQEALAERFGTSRIPVRDALRQLESEGLVILVPNSSAWVAKLDLAECLEIYKIRELIEPLALAEAIPLMSDAEITALEQAAQEIERTPDSDTFLRLDRDFHLTSYRAAPMPRLKALVEQYWNTTQHYRRAYIAIVWKKANWIIYYEHRLLVEAIKRRDAIDAGQILTMHIRRTRLELERHKEVFPEAKGSVRSRRRRSE
jgi:DNA-binding GntR family transcriptional regulator